MIIDVNIEDIASLRDYCRLTARLLRRPIRMFPAEIKPIRPDLVRSYRRVWQTRGAAAGQIWHEDEYDSGELRWSMTGIKPEPGTKPNRMTAPKQKNKPFTVKVQKGMVVITTTARTSQVGLRWGEYRIPDAGGMQAVANRVADHYCGRILDIWRGERVRA